MAYETNDEIDVDFVEKLKKADPRWASVDEWIKVEQELRDCITLKIILQVMGENAEKAYGELLDADPLDSKRISTLQATIKHAKLIGNTLEAIRSRGAALQKSLIEEGELQLQDETGGLS